MSTIIFEDVESNDCEYSFSELEKCINYKKFFDKRNDEILIKNNDSTNNLMLPALGNGLLGTIYRAYCDHVPLSLRPDDIWTAIITSFGNYVKNNSEEMKHCFVEHTGRKQLVVRVVSQDLMNTTREDWNIFLGLMANEIKLNVKSDIVDWIVPSFSTTTETDITISHISLMGTVSEYFDMKFELCCGLSKLTLQGTLDDWTKLQSKCKRLYDFGIKDLSDWADLLIPVLDEFINAYQQNINKDFWQRICTSKRRGSGGQEKFRGWFLVFAPFNDEGKYLLRPAELVAKDNIYATVNDDEIVDCAINVQVTIDDFGEMHQIVFYAGLLMTAYDDTNNTLSPYAGWIMIHKKHIVYEDLIAYLESLIADLRKSAPKEITVIKLAYLENLVKFAYHVALTYHFPNDKLINLVETCASYYRNFGNAEIKKGTGCDYKNFLSWLAEEIHFRYRPNMFAKYIDPKKMDEIINNYNGW
jgi:hypothetical protein